MVESFYPNKRNKKKKKNLKPFTSLKSLLKLSTMNKSWRCIKDLQVSKYTQLLQNKQKTKFHPSKKKKVVSLPFQFKFVLFERRKRSFRVHLCCTIRSPWLYWSSPPKPGRMEWSTKEGFRTTTLADFLPVLFLSQLLENPKPAFYLQHYRLVQHTFKGVKKKK